MRCLKCYDIIDLDENDYHNLGSIFVMSIFTTKFLSNSTRSALFPKFQVHTYQTWNLKNNSINA